MYTAQRGSEMCSIRLDKAKRLMTRDLHVCKGVVFERFNVQFDHYLSVIRVFHSYSISVCLKVKLVSFLQTGQIGKLQCIRVSSIFSCLWWNLVKLHYSGWICTKCQISLIIFSFTWYQILQRHFSAWYSVVASQRIKLGKAKAMSDWRCKLRAWNAWLAYVNHIRSDKEAQTITMEMKEKHRYSICNLRLLADSFQIILL